MYLRQICIAVLGASLLGIAASSVSFSYDDQEAWKDLPGSFCGGMRQSPINIVTEDVQTSDELGDLELNAGWTESRDGEVENTGATAEFIPDEMDALTTTPKGVYRVLQFHIHWGSNASEGSEHRVDGKQYSGEIHFVHELVSGDEEEDSSEEASTTLAALPLAVVAVLLVSDSDLQIAGSPWENFVVPKEFGEDPLEATDIVYADFLPDDLGYYIYEGSLTTPLCDEIVQWFVLKETVKVPAAFLAMLRQLEDENGDPLTRNFRDTQQLNGRVVRMAESDD